ncbi:uncharacterized protein BXZ73DRAFT_75911 [Epithele typhae]|uniref:uncharacterized protein n=1 Tax=Epithele typhae TaxID=378194 RepID=UPI002007D9ED|nr:uncharacterized protein BXZ73DRAFT_75911 [Epithele typhae]KAH9939738.1 hypothetical protein BXZ73DRAFT_75911 [Epithele typhae]
MAKALSFKLLGGPAEQRNERGTIFEFKDPEARSGRFQHVCIQAVLYSVFFTNTTAPACVNQADFNPIPHQTLALVLTVIEHIIEQWASGVFDRNLMFKREVYRPTYLRHLGALDRYAEGDSRGQWRKYCKFIFRQGLASGGAQREAEPEVAISVIITDEEVAADMELLGNELVGFEDSSDVEPDDWADLDGERLGSGI